MNELRSLAEFLRVPPKLSGIEAVFLAATLGISLGMTIGDTNFAHSGIPLPSPASAGGIANQAPKLFIFEIYLIVMGALALLGGNLRSRLASLFRRDQLLLIVWVLLIAGLTRAIPDLRENPLLGIRNSAFVWYLSLPLLVLIAPVRAEVAEFCARAVIGVAMLVFTWSAIVTVFSGTFVLNWLPSTGIYAPLALALLLPSRRVFIPILALLGLGLGFSYWDKYQRTALVGMCMTVGLLVATLPEFRKRVAARTGLLLVFLAVGALAWPVRSNQERKLGNQPLIKSQSDAHGLESFRKTMWLDALGLYAESPIVGIGFQRPVVYRVLWGGDLHVPNDGNWYAGRQLPPISGPHNSYLNALVRMGVLGLLYLPLHAFAAARLWSSRYWGSFFLLMAQAVYALFNVGLEGPVRSALLLLALGVALKKPKRLA
jgi:O-antigen ligase